MGARLKTVAVAACFSAVMLAAPSAHATFPGKNGKIAFGRTGDIWTMNPDGTNQVNLTNDSAAQGSPAWAADGSKLAFTQNDGSGSQIWTMSADGTGRTKLSDGTTGDFDPSWSPDDQRILFTSCCPPGHDFTLETMNADGTGRTVVGGSLDELFETDWASDGSTAWVAADSCHAYASVVTSTFGQLTGSPCGDGPNSLSPSWSPDSQRLAYVLEDCISCFHYSVHTIKRDRTDPQQLTAPPAGIDDGKPAWSPDGSKMAFVRSGRIKVMNADGTGIVDVTDAGDPNWQPIPINAYPRPKGATPMRIPLVPAQRQCTAPNATHGGPLAFGSCEPPQQASSYLTVGTPEANGQPGNSIGFVLMRVFSCPACVGPGPNADVRLDVSLTDVRKKDDLFDYAGELQVDASLRITDTNNTPRPGGPGAGTVSDTHFPFTVSCAATSDTTTGSTCSASTSANAVMPGSVPAGQRSIWELGQILVYDGGARGVAGASDATLFEVEGVFVP